MADIKEYMSVRQFAEKIGVTTQAIRKAISDGRIEAERCGEYFVIHRNWLKKMAAKSPQESRGRK